jgi:rubrerythrin
MRRELFYKGVFMNIYSINEIMEMAIQTEKLGFQFYTGMAEKFKSDQGLARLFTTLANKEQEHEKIFIAIQDHIDEEGPEPLQWEEVSNYMRAFVESEFFLGKEKALPSMDRIRTVYDAVKFALGFEKETLLYFLELRSIVKEKNIIDAVIAEEKSHIRWLALFNAENLKKQK